MRLMSAFACVFPWAGVNAGLIAGNVVWSGVLVNLKVGVASRSHNLREGRDLRPRRRSLAPQCRMPTRRRRTTLNDGYVFNYLASAGAGGGGIGSFSLVSSALITRAKPSNGCAPL